MPAEGQWDRQRRSVALSRRDRGFLAVVACLLLAGAGGGVYAAVTAPSDRAPAAGSGCIEATVPGATGATFLRTCGASARRLCLTEGARGDAVAAAVASACRRAALPLHAPTGTASPHP